MEKNWIEKIKEFVRKAMNEGYSITANKRERTEYFIYEDAINSDLTIGIEKPKGYIYIYFDFEDNLLHIRAIKGGRKNIKLEYTDRDKLEIEALRLSIEEYREDIALSEFNNFFGDEENKVVNINDLDNDDE